MPKKTVIRNIGLLLSGDLANPILDADCIVALDGRIAAIGKAKDLDTDQADVEVDAKGTAVSPGLIDSHVHPVIGDYTPRQSQLSWIDSCLHGGVTTMISAGEVHLPGRPKDIVGLKALAIASQRWYENFRPSGVKVHGGAPVIEQGMDENDFKDLADAGVKLLGEVGLGSVKAGETAKEMVGWARKYGIQSTIHTGGCRHHRPHQRRPHRPARRPDRLPVRTVRARHRAGAQRQRARGPAGHEHGAGARSDGSRDPGH